ncbi:hypothetical protein QVG61_04635 [Thiohalobacter sp. IOR34]|uniref:hypothetical protein n=1 Tax=Thiohalobacter sp. IOR34 TaxID=3057176 RepID=UPI0025B1D024|nr:hypothetical protein [Thiohalobacter sp. IOR34]WJW76386.1 hypothetical protein QVG61_04635 [Thiohalobacter sp. IOR34]
MNKTCLIIVLLLLSGLAGLGYKFIIHGKVAPSSDGRIAILLEPGERDLVLREMRAFLEALQGISQGISQADMEAVARTARKAGLAAQEGVPGNLMGKLPLGFKQLGMDTHRKFDQLALDAEQFGDPETALQQMAGMMQNCVACHAAYRIDAAAAPTP